MPHHVATIVIVTAAGVVLIGYRVGRAHAAWRDVQTARRDLPAKRKVAWGQTRPLLLGMALLLIIAAGYVAR